MKAWNSVNFPSIVCDVGSKFMSVAKLLRAKTKSGMKWSQTTFTEYCRLYKAVNQFGHVLSPGKDQKDVNSARLVQFIARHGGHVVFCIRPNSSVYD